GQRLRRGSYRWYAQAGSRSICPNTSPPLGPLGGFPPAGAGGVGLLGRCNHIDLRNPPGGSPRHRGNRVTRYSPEVLYNSFPLASCNLPGLPRTQRFLTHAALPTNAARASSPGCSIAIVAAMAPSW